MSNVAFMPTPEAHEQPYLGPAEVCEVQAHGLEVQRPDGPRVWARLALAYSYAPEAGDEVLVIGNDDGHYVIGVLRGQGTARLTFAGDVELRSLDGAVRVASAKGVDIDAPEVTLRAQRVQMFASSLREQLGSLYQSVTELWSVRAGSSHTEVEGTAHTQAGRSTLITREEVNINGKKINLG